VLLPVGLAGVLLGAAACGSSGGDSGAAAANSKNTGLDSMTTQELAAQAAKEGSLTWYMTFADDDVQPMVAAFNKTYPNIKVNALRLSADKIPQRIITEQRGGKHNADVVSGDSPQVAQLLQARAAAVHAEGPGPVAERA
jgi:iron(III) transport system substrate-binding protein